MKITVGLKIFASTSLTLISDVDQDQLMFGSHERVLTVQLYHLLQIEIYKGYETVYGSKLKLITVKFWRVRPQTQHKALTLVSIGKSKDRTTSLFKKEY